MRLECQETGIHFDPLRDRSWPVSDLLPPTGTD